MEAFITDLFGPQGLTYVILFLIGSFATFPWRWAGVRLSRNLSAESEVIKWVKAVSTALVAALIARMVLFPGGALAETDFMIRMIAFLIGLVAFYAFGRIVLVGIASGVAALALLGLVFQP